MKYPLIKHLQGAGIFYFDYTNNVSSGQNNPQKFGFWYDSTVSCKKLTYVITTDNQTGFPSTTQYGSTLSSFLSGDNIENLKILKIKDNNKETLFRTFIYSAILSKDSPDTLIRNVIEKMVVSSTCPLVDYLRMLSLLHALQPEHNNQTINNDIPLLPNQLQNNIIGSEIDQKLKSAIDLLKPYFDKVEQSDPSFVKKDNSLVSLMTMKTAMLELESRLFDQIDINLINANQ